MSASATFRQLESTLKEIQRLLRCSICSKTVRGSTRVLPCHHVTCEKCQGKCCGKLVRINRNQQRTDVQEFTQLFSNLLSASVEERKSYAEPSVAKTREKPGKDTVAEADNNPIAKPLDKCKTGKENARVRSAKKAKNVVLAAAEEQLDEQTPVVHDESLVETPLDLSAPAGPRSSFARKSHVVGSSTFWMPIDLSGKPAAVQELTTSLGFQPRIQRRSYTAAGMCSSELNDCGLPPSGVLVSSSPFIPQMDNPREENGNMKRKKDDYLEQKERKKTKLQSNTPEVSTSTSNLEIPMDVDTRAEQPPQQKSESTEAKSVAVSPVKNGTVVRTDDNWDNDEEISLSSPAKLPATPQSNRGEQANTASSGDPFADGEDLDFCFQTPDSKCGKDVLVDRKDESPQQVKSATPKLQATPNRPFSAHKKLDQVKTRLSLDEPPNEDMEAKNNSETPEENICLEDMPEFFSCSSDMPSSSTKCTAQGAEQPDETPKKAKQAVPKPSTPASKTPIRKASDSPRFTTPNKVQRKSLVLCPTRLSRYQTARLETFAATFGAKITRNYTDDVTHVIVTLDKGAVPQTMKYLMAIAGKKWVLECSWIEECLNAKQIVNEELFETTSDDDPGARLSRLSKLPLLPGLRFYIHGSFTSSGASAREWMSLIRTLGGQIEEDVNELASDVLVIGDSNDDISVYDELYEKYQTVTLAWEWVLACTIKYKLEPVTANYCISPKPQYAGELASMLPAFFVDSEVEICA